MGKGKRENKEGGGGREREREREREGKGREGEKERKGEDEKNFTKNNQEPIPTMPIAVHPLWKCKGPRVVELVVEEL